MHDEQGILSAGVILHRLCLGRSLLPGATLERQRMSEERQRIAEAPPSSDVRPGSPDLRPGDDFWGLPPAVLVLAHPDDETIGAGSRLARLGARVTLLYATDGAPRDMRDAAAAGFSSRLDYAAARRAELDAALTLAGLIPEQSLFLGLADQEASFYLPGLARTLAALFRRLRPGLVITHPYEGGHPDHDAVAFAVHAACAALAEEPPALPVPPLAPIPHSALRIPHSINPYSHTPPVLIEMTSYHAGRDGIEAGEFLPRGDAEPLTVELTNTERSLKEAMLACFATQQATLHYFPVDRERFRLAPRYDFAQPPHEGMLFYEHYPWGMQGARWRTLARQALAELERTRTETRPEHIGHLTLDI